MLNYIINVVTAFLKLSTTTTTNPKWPFSYYGDLYCINVIQRAWQTFSHTFFLLYSTRGNVLCEWLKWLTKDCTCASTSMVELSIASNRVLLISTRETDSINSRLTQGLEGTFPACTSSTYFKICDRQWSMVSAALSEWVRERGRDKEELVTWQEGVV